MAAGRFYQSYHRQTGDRFPNRQACLVELKRAPDGYFKTAEFTSQVQAAGGLPWDHTYGAKIACVLVDNQGRCRKGRAPFFWLKDGRQVATNLRNGSQIGVKYLDFTGAGRRQRLHIKLQNSRPSKILVRIDHGSRVVGRWRRLVDMTGSRESLPFRQVGTRCTLSSRGLRGPS